MEQAQPPQIRQRKEIDLTEFGKTGKIVISKPDFARNMAIQNTTMSLILTPEEIRKVQRLENAEERNRIINDKMAENMITIQMVGVLGHIEEAPFHLNDYSHTFKLDFESFMKFMTQEIYDRLSKEIASLDNPLPASTATVQSV